MYREILDKWKGKANPDDDPTNDCLAIARDVYCAFNIPRCRDSNNVNIFNFILL